MKNEALVDVLPESNVTERSATLENNLKAFYQTPTLTFSTEDVNVTPPTTDPYNFANYDGPYPQSWGDAVETAFDSMRLTDTSISQGVNEATEFYNQVNYINKLREMDGEEPINIGPALAWGFNRKIAEERYNSGSWIPEDYKLYYDEVKKRGLYTEDGLRELSAKKVKAKSARLKEQQAVNPVSANVVGVMGGGMTDPVVLATMPMGSEARLMELSMRGIAATAFQAAKQEFIIGSVSEIGVQFQVYNYKEDLDIPHSIADSVINVATAGVGGGLIRGVGSAALDGLRVRNIARLREDLPFVPESLEDVNLPALDELYTRVNKLDKNDPNYLLNISRIFEDISAEYHLPGRINIKAFGPERLEQLGKILKSKDFESILRKITSGEMSEGELRKLWEEHPNVSRLLEIGGFVKKPKPTKKVRDVGLTNEAELRLRDEDPSLYQKYEHLKAERPLTDSADEWSRMLLENRIVRTPQEVENLRAQMELDSARVKAAAEEMGVDDLLTGDYVALEPYKVNFNTKLTKKELNILDNLRAIETANKVLQDLVENNAEEIKHLQTLLKLSKKKGDEYANLLGFKDREDMLKTPLAKDYKKASDILKKENNKRNKDRENADVYFSKRKQEADVVKKAAQKGEGDLPTVKNPLKNLETVKDVKDYFSSKRAAAQLLGDKDRLAAERLINNTEAEVISKINQKALDQVTQDVSMEVMDKIIGGEIIVDPLTGVHVGDYLIPENQLDDLIENIKKAKEIAC